MSEEIDNRTKLHCRFGFFEIKLRYRYRDVDAEEVAFAPGKIIPRGATPDEGTLQLGDVDDLSFSEDCLTGWLESMESTDGLQMIPVIVREADNAELWDLLIEKFFDVEHWREEARNAWHANQMREGMAFLAAKLPELVAKSGGEHG